MIDTGFTDYLALPITEILRHELPFRELGVAQLADGSLTDVAMFESTVEWFERRMSIIVCASEGRPLIGMALLNGLNLSIQAVPGEEVSLSPL